jgi:hypothetical protein
VVTGCSTVNLNQAIDPIGSAGTYRRIVLVEQPLPWPSDIGALPTFAALPRAAGTLVLAVVPPADRPATAGRVTVWTLDDDGRYRGVELAIAGDEQRLTGERLASIVAGTEDSRVHVFGPAGPQVLVCTHGRRDRCCGSLGTALHLELAQRWTGVEVRRCSHLGGHRFAPTALVMPEGRSWAHLTGELLDGVVARSLPTERVSPHLRGSVALDEWAQVVDRAMLERFGWAWLEQTATYTTSVAPDDNHAEVTVAWEDRSARAWVAVSGHEVLVDCSTGEPTGKTSRRFVLQLIADAPAGAGDRR